MSIVVAVIAASFIQGCGVGVEPLMPTPVLFTECGADPLAHIPESERWMVRRVYFATNRARSGDLQSIAYGNTPSSEISAGLALIQFGGPKMSWADLARDSNSADREDVVDLAISGIVEAARFPIDAPVSKAAAAEKAGWITESINDAIEDSRDKDILVYVHGAKVNFYNACAFSAQFDHFMGRDMTSVAFSWPTRQNIMAYVMGGDRRRAYDSAQALATVLELLASETDARRIHVLNWSAGARVVTRALMILRERHPEMSEQALRERLRLGTIYYAAGDVPADEFLEALPTLHAIADRIVITMSSNDNALKTAMTLMGEGGRIGQKGAEITDEQLQMIQSLDRFEAVDVSKGWENRGFDITGHRYWFNHPWASSDVLMAIRTDLLAHERGLVRDNPAGVWYMPDDYPTRLREVVEETDFLRR